jgi:hypothetical protein
LLIHLRSRRGRRRDDRDTATKKALEKDENGRINIPRLPTRWSHAGPWVPDYQDETLRYIRDELDKILQRAYERHLADYECEPEYVDE